MLLGFDFVLFNIAQCDTLSLLSRSIPWIWEMINFSWFYSWNSFFRHPILKVSFFCLQSGEKTCGNFKIWEWWSCFLIWFCFCKMDTSEQACFWVWLQPPYLTWSISSLFTKFCMCWLSFCFEWVPFFNRKLFKFIDFDWHHEPSSDTGLYWRPQWTLISKEFYITKFSDFEFVNIGL